MRSLGSRPFESRCNVEAGSRRRVLPDNDCQLYSSGTDSQTVPGHFGCSREYELHVLAFIYAAAAGVTSTSNRNPASPYSPTGYLQFEQGFNQANDSPAGTDSQFALAQTTKIALTTRFMVQLITQPYTFNRTAVPYLTDVRSSDPGDLQVGGQAILRKETGPAPVVAVGYIRRVRAGSSADLDVGSYSQSALVLLSGDVRGGYHYDSNLVFNEQSEGPVRRAQFVQTLALSHPLFDESTNGKLGGVVELSHATQPFITSSASGAPIYRANTADLLFAAVYSIHPNLVLDAAFEHGLTSTSTQWQGSFGFTYVLPHRLWRDRHPIPIPVGPYHYRNSR